MSIDWAEVGKVAIYALAAFVVGWAGAILQDIVGIKAVASGLIPAATYIMGNRQDKVAFKS